MIAWLRTLPLFVSLLGAGISALYIPMIFAIRLQDWDVARSLFYHATFLLILVGLLAIALSGRRSGNTARHYLLTVLGALITIPAALALPFDHLVPQINYAQAYFEMLSCLTTTGATLFVDPKALPAPLHLMRALVGWLGGFSMLVVACSIFQPLRIGGFEILGQNSAARARQIQAGDAGNRLRHFSSQIFPIYLVVTSLLTLALLASGDRLLVAVSHAMAIMSTSGISPVGGLGNTASAYVGEGVMFLFLIFAVTRHSFLNLRDRAALTEAKLDKEVNLALVCVLVIPSLLFLRHWVGALEVAAEDSLRGALIALWGGLFTTLSFMTTTGFESQAWEGARDWSGLGAPGLLLMALVMLGGGIATTAGGIKLLRIYALFKHGQREIDRLNHPSSVGGRSGRARIIRRQGAFVAWVFLMLFLIALALTALGLTLAGLDFEEALIFATAAISTTGPLVHLAHDGGLSYADLNDPARAILCLAMIVGRLEVLVVVSLLNPSYWR